MSNTTHIEIPADKCGLYAARLRCAAERRVRAARERRIEELVTEVPPIWERQLRQLFRTEPFSRVEAEAIVDSPYRDRDDLFSPDYAWRFAGSAQDALAEQLEAAARLGVAAYVPADDAKVIPYA